MKKYNGKELYKGLLFIKSMMSMNNVNRQKELDQTYALSVGIECEQTVVDDGASTSVDRPQMRQLMEILEISDYKVLVVEDIYEITRNPEDLKSMMDRINDLGVTIFDLGTMSARYNNYAIECLGIQAGIPTLYLLLKQWYLMTMGSQSSNAQQRLRQWNTSGIG